MELNLYQPCFDLIYPLLKRDIQDLPLVCQYRTFVNTYIYNYSFNSTELCCENECFILEVLECHRERLSNVILQD